jgi:hypothetical protein
MKPESPLSLFEKLRSKEVNNVSAPSGNFGNPNLFKLKQGASYTFRLLWTPPADGYDREYPMINQYVHRIWDENSIGSHDVKVYCKTSQYDLGETKAGFDCPMCKAMSAAYKEGANGSKSAQELYKKFRRTLNGYAVVYVVKGPDEDLHQIKILQYTKSFRDFFDENIFGIKKVNKNSEEAQTETDDSEEMIGIDAFMYYDPKNDEVIKTGYNFIVTVGTKRVPINGKMVDMPDYKFKFSNKLTEIEDFDGEEITSEMFLGISEKIGFDRDFYKFSTIEEIEAFKAKYIDGEETVVDEEEDDVEETVMSRLQNKKPVKSNEEDLNLDDLEDDEEEEKPVKKNVTSKTKPIVEDEDEDEDTEETIDESSDDDEIDIDDLLSKID